MAEPRSVTSTTYPFLSIRIFLRSQRHGALALLDTGFTGHLVIPTSSLNGDLGVPDARIDWELADGSIIDAPVYLGVLEIIGLTSLPIVITVLGDDYILGRGVLDRFKVILDHGQQVIIES